MSAEILLAGLIGLIFGSFISMLSWRLPRIMQLSGDEQFKAISLGGSKCPHCHTNLPWYRLIPVISWLSSQGRCHHCKHHISARYPLIEMASALIVMIAIWQKGITVEGGLLSLFLLWLLLISVIDIEHQLILDNLSLPLMWLGLLLNAFELFIPAQDAILGAALGYGLLWSVFHVYRLLTKKEGMGYGDFKLLAALGAWLGVQALGQVILLAALSSILVALILIVIKRQNWQSQMAFGPYLALAGAATMLSGIWI